VISYGTHVEHFQEYQIMWNGNNGRNYFLQNEIPYEAPNQNSLDNPPAPVLFPNSGYGYATYKVADNVTNHYFIGGGCYAVFTINPGMQTDRCFEVNAAQNGVQLRNMLIISLTENGKINNMVNNDGLVANAGVANIPKVAAYH
jgi:hypothetical protein